MGERAFAKSRKGEARSEACIDIIFFLREEGEEDGKRGETGGCESRACQRLARNGTDPIDQKRQGGDEMSE